MSEAKFALRLIRALNFGAQRALAGTEVRCDAATAAHLLRCGDAHLVDEGDLARLAAAVRGNGRWTEPATR